MKNADNIFEFADPDNPIIHAKNVSISCKLHVSKICAILAFLSNFDCPGNSLGSLDNSDEKFLDFLHRTEITAILAYFA